MHVAAPCPGEELAGNVHSLAEGAEASRALVSGGCSVLCPSSQRP